MKGYIQDDKNTLYLPRQDSGVKVLEGNYCDKLRQIGAIGLAGYYGFTTIEGLKIKSVKVTVWRTKKSAFQAFLYCSDKCKMHVVPSAESTCILHRTH